MVDVAFGMNAGVDATGVGGIVVVDGGGAGMDVSCVGDAAD